MSVPLHKNTALELLLQHAALILCVLVAGARCKDESPSSVDASPFTLDGPGGTCATGTDRWQPEDLGQVATTGQGDERVNYFGVWGGAPDAVFLVGNAGHAAFFDGQAWRDISTQSDQTLTAVWGTSATDVWAVGFSGTVLHYDGQDWLEYSPPTELFLGEGEVPDPEEGTPTRRNLWGVWAAGQGGTEALYVVGDKGTVLLYRNSLWSKIPSNVEENLNGVWGSSADAVIIVGDFGTVLTGSSTLSKETTGVAKTLQKVWGRSGTDVYAVGLTGTILHFDGSAWTSVEGAPTQFLRGVWGPQRDPSTLFLVGWDGTLLRMTGGPDFSSGATFEEYNCFSQKRLEAIWGTEVPVEEADASLTPADASDLDGGPSAQKPLAWIVGAAGTVLRGP